MFWLRAEPVVVTVLKPATEPGVRVLLRLLVSARLHFPVAMGLRLQATAVVVEVVVVVPPMATMAPLARVVQPELEVAQVVPAEMEVRGLALLEVLPAVVEAVRVLVARFNSVATVQMEKSHSPTRRRMTR
jgi:hypothetical protein